MASEGRLAKAWSCSCSTSRAASAEETMRVGTRPRWSNMTGPCATASACRARCGSAPSWWRLPTIGRRGGDGGSRCRSAGCLLVRDLRESSSSIMHETVRLSVAIAGKGNDMVVVSICGSILLKMCQCTWILDAFIGQSCENGYYVLHGSIYCAITRFVQSYNQINSGRLILKLRPDPN